jgi:hypothetical protein
MLEFPTPKQSVSHSLPEKSDNQLLCYEIAYMGDFPTSWGIFRNLEFAIGENNQFTPKQGG